MMTVGTNPARAGLVLLIMAMVPLLLAITINLPANAGTVVVEEGPTPSIEAPPIDTAGQGYEVILNTGVEVVGNDSSISALAIVATPDSDGPSPGDAPGD
jgi:hypothetical protein